MKLWKLNWRIFNMKKNVVCFLSLTILLGGMLFEVPATVFAYFYYTDNEKVDIGYFTIKKNSMQTTPAIINKQTTKLQERTENDENNLSGSATNKQNTSNDSNKVSSSKDVSTGQETLETTSELTSETATTTTNQENESGQ